MRDTTATRRDLLRSGGGLAALVASGGLSGCAGLLGSDLPARSDTAVLEHAPERAIAATHVDIGSLVSDRQLRAAIDSQLGYLHGVSDRVPRNTTVAMTRIDERTGLDPRELDALLAVIVRPPDTGEDEDTGGGLDPLAATEQGMLVWSGWSSATVRHVLGSYAETVRLETYRGFDVLTARVGGDPLVTVGVAAEGRYAVGDRTGVEALLDVADGGASAAESELAAALAAAQPGPARVAVAPQRQTDRTSGFGDPVALLAGKINVAYGSLYADGDRRGVELVLETGSRFDAEDVHESAESVLALARSGQIVPALEPVLSQVTAERSGSTVTLRYEAGVGAFASTLLSSAATVVLGGTA